MSFWKGYGLRTVRRMRLCCARWLLIAFTVSVISACGSESVPVPVLSESLADKRWLVIQANDSQGQEIAVVKQQIDSENPFGNHFDR